MPIEYPYKFSDWYGYDQDCAVRTSFFRYDGTIGKPVFECDISRDIDREIWHDGTFANPQNGDVVYTTATGNNYLGSGNYSTRGNSGTNTPLSIITIGGGGNGVITAILQCIF